VVRERRTVGVTDYQAQVGAPGPLRDLGLRSAVAIPIFAQGEIAAILFVARLEVRPFDEDELAALEAFTAHAATALAASRIIEQARRIEIVGRGVAEATPVQVLERVADEAAALFHAEFVVSVTIAEDMRVVRGARQRRAVGRPGERRARTRAARSRPPPRAHGRLGLRSGIRGAGAGR